jgi:hypothetical protein
MTNRTILPQNSITIGRLRDRPKAAAACLLQVTLLRTASTSLFKSPIPLRFKMASENEGSYVLCGKSLLRHGLYACS